MLPQDAYRGARPPVLLDYLDDEVSAVVRVRGFRKIILVQAPEFMPPLG